MRLGRNICMHELDAETASGESRLFDVSDLKSLAAILKITSVSGTLPTLNVTIEQAAIFRGPWPNYLLENEVSETLITFSQQTGVATVLVTAYDTGKIFWANLIRAKWVIGGSSPSFAFTVEVVGKP